MKKTVREFLEFHGFPVEKWDRILRDGNVTLEMEVEDDVIRLGDHQFSRIVGTENAVVINDRVVTQYEGIVTTISFVEGWYKERKLYGKKCRKVAKGLSLPVGVVLAVGPELAAEYADIYANISKEVLDEVGHELCCGIDRRINGILFALGETSPELYARVSGMGQKHSDIVADHLLSKEFK